MDRIYSKIYRTYNYDKFKILDYNRDITRFDLLNKSIANEGIKNPILVDEDFNILDGQHRYTYAKENEKPIIYFFVNARTHNDVVEINTTSKRWQIIDYIEHYAKQTNKEYMRLYDAIKDMPYIRQTDIICVGYGLIDRRKVKILELVKKGEFTFRNYAEFLKIAQYYKQFIEATQINSVAGVFLAYYNLYTIIDFDKERLLRNVNSGNTRERLLGVSNFNYILKEFVAAYNKNRVQIHYTQTESVDFLITNDRKKYIIRRDQF